MKILIFDMDGVLLEAQGYHQALQDTVRLIGEYLSLSNIELSKEQIHTFESIGISSEWHSSALCMAFLKIQLLSGETNPTLDLQELFSEINTQPFELTALNRSINAVHFICKKRNICPKQVISLLTDCENINLSLTMQWFQELVLGSETYQTFYNRPCSLNMPSYLQKFDVPLLSEQNAEKILNWMDGKKGGVAIMTNRPSSGPEDFSGSPEAESGRNLVQLSGIPIIGYGDISWLARSTKADPGTLAKPNATHALAAILRSIGLDTQLSLVNSVKNPIHWSQEILNKLDRLKITVYEDTSVGIISARNAVDALRKVDIYPELHLVGIAKDEIKKAALEAQGAQVFPDINMALLSREDFGSLTRY